MAWKTVAFSLWLAHVPWVTWATESVSNIPLQPTLKTEDQISDAISAWQELNLWQQLALEDHAITLRSVLLQHASLNFDDDERYRHYFALQHSGYCARLHLHGQPLSRQWIYRAEQLVIDTEFWQQALREFNRKNLKFTRPDPSPAGCI